MRIIALLLPLLVGLSLVVGCGDDSEDGGGEKSPRAAVDEYLAAIKATDGKRICAIYSSGYRDLSENDPDNESGASCERQAEAFAKQARDEPHELLSVEESGERGVAIVSCEDSTASDCSLPLVREDGGWRIDGSPSPND